MDVENSQNQETNQNEIPVENSRCSKINTKLLSYKSFYFLFFSAIGSLFPYLAIFYKQLELSARQTGVLIGIRPLLQLVSSSAWGIIAEKLRATKLIFIISLIGWIFANFSLSLVKNNDTAPCRDNGSLTILDNSFAIVAANGFLRNETSYDRVKSKRNFTTSDRRQREEKSELNKTLSKIQSNFMDGMIERKIEEESSIGHAPWPLDSILNLKIAKETTAEDDNRTFIILLVITIVGTFIAAPAIPFVDTATLQVLGEKRNFYGKQRQWGALGWGVSSFVVGSIVSTLQERSRCNVPDHIDYKPAFYAFAAIMVLAIVPALFIKFEERSSMNTNLKAQLQALVTFQSVLFLIIIQQFGNSWGLLQTFLLWHLHNLGGTQFLFSIIAAVQCLSEVLCYQLAGYAIMKLGHNRVLYIGLLFSSLRFCYYSIITDPWLVVPIELFHGVSTTLIWALAVSFISTNTGVATAMQGILSGIHWGLGVGGGSILGGLIINAVGSKYTFLANGIFTFLNLVTFTLIQNITCVRPGEEQQSLLSKNSQEDSGLDSVEMESVLNYE